MSRPVPAHGTAARYSGTSKRPGCRCAPCTAGHRRAGKERTLAKIRGVELRVDKAPVIDHIRMLQAAGMSQSQIGRAAGRSQSTIATVLDGSWLTVNRATAEAILRVRPGAKAVDPLGVVPAVGSTRRVRALYAMAHSRGAIAAASELHLDTISGLAAERWQNVTVHTAESVKRAYNALSMHTGTAPRNRTTANREGWLSPLAWDEETIDDPSADPATGRPSQLDIDQVAVIRALEGERLELSGLERTAAVEYGARVRGMDFDHIAEALGMERGSVKRTWERIKQRARLRGETWPNQPQWTDEAWSHSYQFRKAAA